MVLQAVVNQTVDAVLSNLVQSVLMLCDSVVAALMALKRKKGLEKHLQKIDHTLLTIEYHRQALELANTIEETLKILSDATKALQSSHQRP